jgi:phosphoserine phosphatase RsbU/P
MMSSDLRAALPYLLLGTVVLVAGLATMAFSALKVKDTALMSFGSFAGLYGARLLIVNRIFRAAFEVPPNVSEWCEAVISYTILVPGALFFRVLIGNEWMNSATWVLRTTIVFAPVAIVWAAIAGNPWAPNRVNNVIVITITLLGAGFVVHRFHRRGRKSLILCFLLFVVTVVIANLQFDNGSFDPEPLGFLVLLVALGSLAAGRALERERRLKSVEYELEAARRIQNSILPRSAPSIPGLVVTARYEPMTEVAGDFYDFIVVDERRLTILVADVSGHGVPAALVASMLKVVFGAQNECATDPAEVLSRINAALHGTLDRQFVTAACAHIDLGESTVHYSGAGHPPSLLWKSGTGELVELSENGLLLGPFRNATYKNVRHSVEAGDLVLLYTDGLVEGTSIDGQPIGDEGLRSFVRANGNQKPTVFVDRLLQTALVGVRQDDITLVLAKLEACQVGGDLTLL